MEKAYSFYVQGQLRAAIAELGEQLRREPGSSQKRTFLFELLCFAGEFDRAAKQLDVLAAGNENASTGATLLRDLLAMHRERERLLEDSADNNKTELRAFAMKINGVSYSSCADAEQQVEGGLEIFGTSGYELIWWGSISRLETSPPKRLRDLLWLPASLFLKGAEEKESPYQVYLPMLAPSSWKHPNEEIQLGRTSAVEEDANGKARIYGTKLLLCDEKVIPFVDVRTLEVDI